MPVWGDNERALGPAGMRATDWHGEEGGCWLRTCAATLNAPLIGLRRCKRWCLIGLGRNCPGHQPVFSLQHPSFWLLLSDEIPWPEWGF